jgi:hypothetical protein
MSVISSLAVQQAIHAHLAADASLMAQVGGVYDAVPQGATYPYVVLDEQGMRSWNTTTTQGAEITLALHVFSREAGRKQLLLVLERLYALLHEAALSVSGQSFTHVHLTSQEVELTDDAVTFHGMQQYRITTHV